MAVTSLWRVKSNIKRVVVYVENDEKTTEESIPNSGNPIDSLVGYVERDSATNRKTYTYGINCSPETASQDMLAVKRHFDKMGGVIAYHGYQSFAQGEVTPEQAHEIGKQLAMELWGDKYQVLVTTHLDKSSHLHNHFVLNTVAITDGKKYFRSVSDYNEMQQVSDRLCRENGLSVITNPIRKGMNYREWQDEKEGRSTVRGEIRKAIDEAILNSVNVEDFKTRMDEMGYIINQNGKYPKIKHIGAEHFVRFRSLGEGYSIDDIYARILGNYSPKHSPEKEQDSPQKVFEDETDEVGSMGYVAVYRCYIRAISITMTRKESNIHLYRLMANEHRRFERYKAEFRIAAENKLETDVDLLNFRVKTMEALDGLLEQRKALKSSLKAAQRAQNAQKANNIGFDITEISRWIRRCREELRAVDSIAERSGIMREKLEIIAKERFKGKENSTNEHERRCGRAGPQDES